MANAQTVADELERFAERVIVKITLDVHANLVEATPVDTGWAQNNWVPELGVRQGPPAPNPGGGAAGGAAARMQAGVATVVAGYSFPDKVSNANRVPYIRRLNDGHSAQAPRGFVQEAIRKALTQDLRGLSL